MIGSKLKFILASATIAAGLVFSGAASAATYTSDLTCALTDVTGGGSNADDCFGTEDGNPSSIGETEFETGTFEGYFGDTPGSLTSTTGLFGKTEWDEVARFESGGALNLTIGDNPSDPNDPSEWTVLNNALQGYEYVAVMLKQSTLFAAYLFDPAETQGTWYTSWWDNDPGTVSNITIWAGREDGCTPTVLNDFCGEPTDPEVPLPAGLPLMLTAIGVGAYLRKRSRKSA